MDSFDKMIFTLLIFFFVVFVCLIGFVYSNNALNKAECIVQTCDNGLKPLYMPHDELCICAQLPK